MKKLLLTICSMGMISICSLAQIQDRDTTSINMSDRDRTDRTREEMKQDAKGAGDEIQQGAERTGNEIQQGTERTGNEIKKGADKTGSEIQQGAQSTDQELENDAKEMERNLETATIDKVGPNGEKLFMERGKYYYFNAEGKKVKVKKSEVKDKSVEENVGTNNNK